MIVAESTYLLVQSAVSKDMTSIVVPWSLHRPQQHTVVPKRLDDALGCISFGNRKWGVPERVASRVRGVSHLALLFSGSPAPKGFTIIPDFDFGVNASRERIKYCSSRQNVIWHDMEMSEHVFFLRAKAFDN